MKPNSKEYQISAKTYVGLALAIITFLLLGGYVLELFPKEVNPIFVIIGVLVTTVFLLLYLKNNQD